MDNYYSLHSERDHQITKKVSGYFRHKPLNGMRSNFQEIFITRHHKLHIQKMSAKYIEWLRNNSYNKF